MAKIDFAAIMKEATQAASDAADKWVSEHTKPIYEVRNADVITGKPYGPVLGQMLDLCGIAFVKIDDKRTSFSKYVAKIQNGYNNAVHFGGNHSRRQEWGLNEARAYAALGVLTKHGIKGVSVWSRID